MKEFLKYYLKTFKDIVTREPIVATLIASIFFYSFFYPTAYKSQQPTDLPIVIVNEEKTVLNYKIIDAVFLTPNVRVIHITGNFLEAQQLVQDDKASGILYLPNALSESLLQGKTGGIGIYLSATNLLASKKIGEGIATSIEDTLRQQLAPFLHISAFSPSIPIHQIPLYNTLSGYGSYVFPAIAPLIIHQIIILGLTMLIAGFRESQWRPKVAEFWGIFFAVFTIGCLGSFYFFGLTFWFYDYPHGGNLWGMLIAVPIFVSCIIGLSLLIATFLDCAERVGQIFVATSVPLFILSGIAWPYEAMPTWVHWLGQVLPSSIGIQMFIQLNQMGVPTIIVIPKLIYLSAFGLICLILAFYRLRKLN
ncbi:MULTISPECIES: ABC transporter permease [unclassified Acinetobacter]|uniref:ABC transporter permease n=1 Tax=unclassified Acinetobacter TaxID=196816 RepID=UPI0029352830|nr:MULTISPECIES: ABC transporter permease [unclassified Acinetobacter]WOE31554.1 ABC transporter permease [Acinetobacter sp. SAAs470]WOE39751.1 ABC transporter permease [Acinetobacter sp. SAAs474]